MGYLNLTQFIDPYQKYVFFDQFDEISEGKDKSSCDVYIISRAFENNEVVDFSKIPYRSGKIHFVISDNSIQRKNGISIKGKIYAKECSFAFCKGPYFGRQYQLARQVALINDYFRKNHAKHRAEGKFTHDGNAYNDKNVIGLVNSDDINRTFVKIYPSLNFSPTLSKKILGTVLSIFFIGLIHFDLMR